MKKIIVYSTPTCPYCTMVKDYLKDNDITFEEKNVAADPDAANEMVNLTQQSGVPVTVIDNDYVVGFHVEKISELLQK